MKFLKLQQQYHPDVSDGGTESSDINQAYSILRDNLSRAKYLVLWIYLVKCKRLSDRRTSSSSGFVARCHGIHG